MGGGERALADAVAPLEGEPAPGTDAGCTEIELLVRPDDLQTPYYPTTRLKTLAAVEWILSC